MKRVVITGLGALTPLGNTVQEYWQNLLAGKSGAASITKFDASKFKTQFACELKNFNLEDYFDKKEIRKNDPFTLYALIACDEAVQHSGLDMSRVNRNRFGTVWASGNGGITTFQEQVAEYAQGDGTPRFSPFFIPKILADTPSGAIGLRYEIRGINYCTVSACASATSAIMDAFNYIKWGKADLMLAGGSEAPICEAGIGGFNALKALSTRNDSPQTASRPMDPSRDGFVMGEGAGALVLEELEHAQARGATIYAELVGAGMSCDAYHSTATHPEGLGAQLAMEMALDDAGVDPQVVDHANLHATSTPVGDTSEIAAMQKVFGKHLTNIALSATKSSTGHLLGAAGAIEAVATVLAVHEQQVPPTINTQELDPELPDGLQFALGQAQEKKIDYAISNTFGFGGHNAIALFKRWEGQLND
jgi:3-oxoacyl-[acyl-carrier-protein] synthase II